jgi:hypothetical protein
MSTENSTEDDGRLRRKKTDYESYYLRRIFVECYGIIPLEKRQ